MANYTSKTKRRVVKKNHPWKSTSFKSAPKEKRVLDGYMLVGR